MNTGRLFVFDAVILILIQSVITGMIDVSVYLEIIVLPLYILHLPMRTSTPALLLAAFLTGLATDIISSDIVGLFAASMVPLAFLRSTITRITTSKKKITSYSDIELAEMPPAATIPYYVLSTFIFCIFYFGIEAVFAGDSFVFFLTRMIVSFFVNTLVITTSGLFIFRK